MRESAAFRVKLAELGHPVIGPQSFYKLTHGEIRIYAEGMKFEQDQKQEDQAYSGTSDALGSGPSYNRESKKKRDAEALRKAEQRASN